LTKIAHIFLDLLFTIHFFLFHDFLNWFLFTFVTAIVAVCLLEKRWRFIKINDHIW